MLIVVAIHVSSPMPVTEADGDGSKVITESWAEVDMTCYDCLRLCSVTLGDAWLIEPLLPHGQERHGDGGFELPATAGDGQGGGWVEVGVGGGSEFSLDLKSVFVCCNR
ncbi:hypothetical protein BaRGS_00002572 [Batillaria attramentaria]|uniref:Uncharacterized protein n=1 Tax=Batillaria attramentaria TaxID=370345 RepID=A0ABD0M4N9_9CAEN